MRLLTSIRPGVAEAEAEKERGATIATTTGASTVTDQEAVQDDMVGIRQASLLQQYRDRLLAAESEFSKYLSGGRGIGESETTMTTTAWAIALPPRPAAARIKKPSIEPPAP